MQTTNINPVNTNSTENRRTDILYITDRQIESGRPCPNNWFLATSQIFSSSRVFAHLIGQPQVSDEFHTATSTHQVLVSGLMTSVETYVNALTATLRQ